MTKFVKNGTKLIQGIRYQQRRDKETGQSKKTVIKEEKEEKKEKNHCEKSACKSQTKCKKTIENKTEINNIDFDDLTGMLLSEFAKKIISQQDEMKDLESRLSHSDKVNLANINFINDLKREKEKDTYGLRFYRAIVVLLASILAYITTIL